MKKILITIAMILTLCLSFVACGNETGSGRTDSNLNGSSDISSGTDTNGSANTVDSTPSSTKDTVTADTSIKVDYDADREAQDNEFPFDNIVIERNGYDIVAAGKYYGKDFDNIKYYGSYYRIIDNYADFSELTQWGNQLDEAIFDDNFVLVLYSYTKCSVYYSHPKFNEVNDKGQFSDFKLDVANNKISISETHSVNGMNIDKDGYVPPKIEDYTVIYPIEKQEIIYLLISKDERPSNLPKNGEIDFYKEIIVEE